MPHDWPVAKKVLQLKGDLSYRELEADILKKTGQRIPFTNLARLAKGEQQGSPRVISILAEYAGKPISWFYETDQPSDPVAEARAKYLAPTGDAHVDKWRRILLELLDKQKGPPATPEEVESYVRALAYALVELALKAAKDDEQNEEK